MRSVPSLLIGAMFAAVSVVAVNPPAGASPPPDRGSAEREVADWWGELSAEQETVSETPVAEPPQSAPPIRDTPLDAEDLPPAEHPAPAVAEVTLAERGVSRQVGETPVSLSAEARTAVGDKVQVEVLGGAAAERAGVPGPLFRLTGPDGARLDERNAEPVTVSVDYSTFAGRFGAGYADRLQAVALPACAVADPVPEGCDTSGTRLDSENLLGEDRLVVDVDDLAGMQADAAPAGVVLALLAGPEGDGGSFKATPFSVSGDWDVGLGSGEFSWNYNVPLPAAPGGPTPR